MKHFLPFFLILAITLGACKSTKRAYEQGDYQTAVVNSVDRLRSSPDNKKARETLAVAYPAMLDYFQQKISQAHQSPNPLRWESIMDYYAALNLAHDEIMRSPAARRVIPSPQYFASEYQESRRKAADAHYLLGEEQLGLAVDGDREAGKEAYAHFMRTDELLPNYKDAAEQAQYARNLATLMVAIEPIPIHARALELSNEFFQNQIIEYVASSTWDEFVYVYPSDERQSRQPDQVIRMTFDDFVVGQAYVKETVRERTKDSVIIDQIQVTPDSTRPLYATVKAEAHLFEKQVTSTGLLDVKIIDTRSGRILTQRKFPGTHTYVDRWGYYNGDERALADDDDRYMRRNRESPTPAPQDLFIEFTRPIYSQVIGFLSDYYRGY